MPELRAIPASRFYVEFQGLEQKMVKSVTELNFKGQTAGHKTPLASTKNGMTLWQTTSAGWEQNPNFTIEVYIAEGDMDFYNWMKSTMPKSDGGDGAWNGNRRDGSIVGYDSDDKEVTRWNITKAWIKSYQLADLATDKSDLIVEKFEILCEQMNRVK